MNSPASSASRLLLLASKLGYQTRSFAEAAKRLGVEVVIGSDRCHQLDDPWSDGAIPLHFEEPEQAAARLVEAVRDRPVGAILALGDRQTVTAAYAARSLDLSYNSPESVENCRSKLRQRRVLRAASLPVPNFFSFSRAEPIATILPRVNFPCVLKPVRLAASQGVIRANDAQEFIPAVERIQRLLTSPEMQVTREQELDRLLVEDFIPGAEVALEGLIDRGRLRVLALFDKPDPLDGPYFEESIYITPSRLPQETQKAIFELAARVADSARSFRRSGPRRVPSELRRTLGPRDGSAPNWGSPARGRYVSDPERILLEELLVRHAMGLPGADMTRESLPAGVMMIPVPASGILESVEGVERAALVPGVDEIQITARLHDFIAAWPEGSTYLGFIFARAETPAETEAALRRAHEEIRFTITPRLAVAHPAAR